MTLTPPRWEAPEVVDPPTTAGLVARYRRLNEATGMTSAGWVCLTAGIVSVGLGLLFGWQEFTVVGVLAIATVGLALLFTIGKPRLDVAVGLEGRSVVVGEPASGVLTATNAAERRHWGSRMDLPVGDTSASFTLPALKPGESSAHTFRIPTHHRGVVGIGPARSVQGDPFALTGRESQWTQQTDLYVHPRTVPLPGRHTGFVHDLEGHATPHLSAADMNFHALRPYAPGDDRRHVHWRSTARAGRLMVKQFEESRMSRVVVGLDTGRASYIDEDEFELAISCAGSVALQTLHAESPLALLTSRDTLVTVTPGRTLDELSGVVGTTRGGVVDLVHGVLRREPGASVAVCVTGSTATMAQLRAACSHFDVDTRVIGIRVSLGDEARARTAGNVTVLQIGQLEHLPRAMRKAME